jgi:UDP-N-acetylglucosamine 2-epimerase (non-hydrolysing)
VLDIPCLTLRNSTERPETVTMGTNELIGDDLDKLKNCLNQIMNNNWKKGNIPQFWDGHTSGRIVEILFRLYGNK